MNQGINAVVAAVIAAAVFSGVAFGQTAVKPVTVCEVLADTKKFTGTPVVIVGRLDCSWSLVDHTCHLAEDGCKRTVTTQGDVWPTKILVVDSWEEGMPKPPTGNPQFDNSSVLQKLSSLRKTTKLGFHKEPRFRKSNGTITFSKMADVPDEWGFAYGRFFTTANLTNPDCSDEVGCRGFDGAPAALIINPDSLKTYK